MGVQIIQAAGPWATLFALVVGLLWSVARGKLVPKSQVDARLADKQQIVDFHTTTTQRLLDAIEERERNVEILIKQMSTLAATLNGGK